MPETLGMPTELELLDAWRAGDRDAGSALLERQFDGLFRFFRSKVAPESVGELVQQTAQPAADP